MTAQAMAVPLGPRAGYTRLTVELGLTFGGSGPTASARNGVDGAIDDDATLVASVATGDSKALEQLYERHSRGVYSLAMRLLTDGPAAEEVVQETFLKLWRQPSAYQPSRGRLLPWLFGVAHHHAVDVLRRRQLEQRRRVSPSPHVNGDGLTDLVDSLGLTSSDGDPQSRADGFEQQLAVAQALGSLPVEQRLPVELAYYKGRTQLEIATLLSLPLGTVKTRMRLGLQQLRKAPELARLWSDR
ncbi:MAG: sigma-70 family RNA polymerase sigma factor [Chloroflexi bacterium]|nr:sigma-70 family RNA polymerase sigma factor [Chloroflexota bacterium]